MSEYMCLRCLKISKEADLQKKQCPRCENTNLIQTHNASDGVDIGYADLYRGE